MFRVNVSYTHLDAQEMFSTVCVERQILIEGGFECIKMKCIHFTVQHLWLILYITIVSISRWIGDLISVKRKTEEVDENEF